MAWKITDEQHETIKKVNKIVCDYFGVDEKNTYERNRYKNVDIARGFVFLIMHKRYGLSYGQLAFAFKRDARTIRWNVSNTARYIRIYKEFEKYDIDLDGLTGND